MLKSMNFVCMLIAIQGIERSMLTRLKTNGMSGLANQQCRVFFSKRISLETVQAFLMQQENTKAQLKCANILEKRGLVQCNNRT